MYEELYKNGRNHSFPTNYIYCSICESLVFILKNGHNSYCY